MEFSIGMLLTQVVNFLLIMFVYKKFVADWLNGIISDRKEAISKANDANKVYEDTLAKAEQDKKMIIDEAVAHKAKLVEEASLSAQKKADGILADAEKKAGNIVTEAEEHAQKLEKELKDNFQEGVKKTAHVVVKKLFAKDVSLKDEYLDTLVKEYSS